MKRKKRVHIHRTSEGDPLRVRKWGNGGGLLIPKRFIGRRARVIIGRRK